MTWIRWDVDAPRSAVVGFLADRLGVDVATALGHYCAVCCGFGAERPDGRIDQVPDAMLENWAVWQGKRGRFAAAMRAWCQQAAETGGDPGVLRGWLRRNGAVLEKQAKDARRPDGRRARTTDETPPDSRQNPARDFGGDAGGNVDDNGSTAAAAGAGASGAVLDGAAERADWGPAWVRLYGRLPNVGGDRWAVEAFLADFPDAEIAGWVAVLLACLDGIDLPGGRPPSSAQLATTCRDFRTKKPHQKNPHYFRVCLGKLMTSPVRGDQRPPFAKRDQTERNLTAALEFAGTAGTTKRPESAS